MYCIYGTFNDVVINSDFLASDDRMNNEQRIGKDMEGSDSGLILTYRKFIIHEMPYVYCRK
jgi:hypothetical protein